MKKKLWVGIIAGLAGSAFLINSANATIINEISGNDTLATAQNVDGAFSVGANADIFGADTNLPWVSINATGDGTYDYFSFTVAAGITGYFDVDYGRNQGGSIDTEIALWDSAGNVLMERDDGSSYQSSHDSGTVHGYDPSIDYLFNTAGTYFVGIAEYYSSAQTGGWSGNRPDNGDTYTLQISLTDHNTGAPVPEPATMLLFGTGLIGLMGYNRKRFNKKS